MVSQARVRRFLAAVSFCRPLSPPWLPWRRQQRCGKFRPPSAAAYPLNIRIRPGIIEIECVSRAQRSMRNVRCRPRDRCEAPPLERSRVVCLRRTTSQELRAAPRPGQRRSRDGALIRGRALGHHTSVYGRDRAGAFLPEGLPLWLATGGRSSPAGLGGCGVGSGCQTAATPSARRTIRWNLSGLYVRPVVMSVIWTC